MVTTGGQVVGEHLGLMYYTIGQRQGLGIGGRKDGDGDAWYVAEKDMESNRLIVVQGHGNVLLLHRRLEAGDASWVAGQAPGDGPFGAKTRYRQGDSACSLTNISPTAFELAFDAPQWAVTPGQSAVLYRNEVCLGGGIIASRGNDA
jgi:tRNA-specific 2-thiouridylase